MASMIEQLASYAALRMDAPKFDPRTGERLPMIACEIVNKSHGFIVSGYDVPFGPGEHIVNIYETDLKKLQACVEDYLRDTDRKLPEAQQARKAEINREQVDEAFSQNEADGIRTTYEATFAEVMRRDPRPLTRLTVFKPAAETQNPSKK